MRTNRPAHRTCRPRHLGRPSLASMFVAATVAAAVTILVTVAVVALACYLAGAPSAPRGGATGGGRPAATASEPGSQHLLDPTAGRGANSATCKHAPRSPRCLREGGTAAVVRDQGLSLEVESASDQTVLLGGEGARPARVPGRVPGRGGWVSELGPSRA